jgi:hypothetical protein
LPPSLLVFPPIVPINSSKLSFWNGRPQHDGRPSLGELAAALLREEIAIAHIEDQPGARPLRRVEITADAACRMHPVGDELAIDERVDKCPPGYDCRVPCALHGRRKGNGRHGCDRPPREGFRVIQRPLEIAPHPGAAPGRKKLRGMLVGDRRALALHGIDLDDPREKFPIQRPRWLRDGHCNQARSSITSATASPLQ